MGILGNRDSWNDPEIASLPYITNKLDVHGYIIEDQVHPIYNDEVIDDDLVDFKTSEKIQVCLDTGHGTFILSDVLLLDPKSHKVTTRFSMIRGWKLNVEYINYVGDPKKVHFPTSN